VSLLTSATENSLGDESVQFSPALHTIGVALIAEEKGHACSTRPSRSHNPSWSGSNANVQHHREQLARVATW
jgi:hypothetical protein